jgi:hypothetical protein
VKLLSSLLILRLLFSCAVAQEDHVIRPGTWIEQSFRLFKRLNLVPYMPWEWNAHLRIGTRYDYAVASYGLMDRIHKRLRALELNQAVSAVGGRRGPDDDLLTPAQNRAQLLALKPFVSVFHRLGSEFKEELKKLEVNMNHLQALVDQDAEMIQHLGSKPSLAGATKKVVRDYVYSNDGDSRLDKLTGTNQDWKVDHWVTVAPKGAKSSHVRS